MADLRLSAATLSRLSDPPPVAHPQLHPRILHLGLGAFHRAHQCVYTERANALAGSDWGIVSVANSNRRLVDGLLAQDCYYSVTELRPDGARTAVNGNLVDALVGGDDPGRVRALVAAPTTAIVTLTITEKGYTPDGSLIGLLAAGLADRHAAGGPPVTVLTCDNMAGNGARLQAVVAQALAGLPGRSPDLAAWLAASVTFPSTVVDRIVPATTPADRERATAALGLEDAAPVAGEPFAQWVIEDAFAAGRPPWELAGVELVADVTPYQVTKLRLLNGSHSALAYLGLATGCQTVAEAMAAPWGAALVRGLCAEIAPTLPPGGPDPTAYAESLVTRFENPGIVHQLRQIGSDGSQKLPYRWLDAVRRLRAEGRPAPLHALALAAWVLATRPPTEPPSPTSQFYGTTDPNAAALAACWTDTTPPIAELLAAVGAADLAADAALVRSVADAIPIVAHNRVEELFR
ncbi:MAG: mannitol dehydrogenase family protein [Propionibacteriaceae bacterium]|jgi:fructuronate reductase|nr:mannitol dehydrogenase family protein [Propionibacteriaceae bacterium]